MGVYPYIIFKGGIVPANCAAPDLSKKFGQLICNMETIPEVAMLLNLNLDIFLTIAFDYEGEIAYLKKIKGDGIGDEREVEKLISAHYQEWEQNKATHEAAWFEISSFRSTIQNLRYALMDLEPTCQTYQLISEIDDYFIDKTAPCFLDELTAIERYLICSILEGATFCSFDLG